MANIANLTANDAETTPVSHVFYPVRTDASGILWREDLASTPLVGQGTVTASVRKLPGKADVEEVRFRVALPALETVSTAGNTGGYVAPPAKAYAVEFEGRMLRPARATKQHVKNVRAIVVGLLNNAGNIQDMVDQGITPV